MLRRPRVLVAAAAVNVLVVPAVAVALVTGLALDGPVAYGIVLAQSRPAGAPARCWHTTLAVIWPWEGACRAALAVLGLLAVPAWSLAAPYAGAAIGGAGTAPVVAMPMAQLIPIAAGVWLRGRQPALAGRVHKLSRKVTDVRRRR